MENRCLLTANQCRVSYIQATGVLIRLTIVLFKLTIVPFRHFAVSCRKHALKKWVTQIAKKIRLLVFKVSSQTGALSFEITYVLMHFRE